MNVKNIGQGLQPFLPTADLHFPPVSAALTRSSKPQLPPQSRFETADFSLEGIAKATNSGSRSRLEFVVKVLMRYQYALSDTGELGEILIGIELHLHSDASLPLYSDEKRALISITDQTPEKSALIELENSKAPL